MGTIVPIKGEKPFPKIEAIRLFYDPTKKTKTRDNLLVTGFYNYVGQEAEKTLPFRSFPQLLKAEGSEVIAVKNPLFSITKNPKDRLLISRIRYLAKQSGYEILITDRIRVFKLPFPNNPAYLPPYQS